MHRRNRKFYLAILVCLLFMAFTGFKTVQAQEKQIDVTIEEGFNGKIKMGKGFPLFVKMKNNGEDFSGSLLVNFNPSWNSGGTLAINIELPAGSTKTYQIAMPGLTDDNPSAYQNEPSIFLYKGDWRDNKSVEFSGENRLKPKFIDFNEKIIGVLSEKYDRLRELRVLPSMPAQMIELKKEEMPKQSLGLEMLDYIIIDEYGVSQLDEDQQQALIAWIKNGGVLIAGGSPNGSQGYDSLYSLLPMKMDQESLGTSDFLLGINQAKPDFKNIQLFTGDIEKGSKVLEKSGDTSAAVMKNYGNGVILQTGFSLGDEPLSSWNGYSYWFSRFIDQAKPLVMDTGNYGPDFYGSMYWEFVETNEYFPASNFSVGGLIGLLAGYIIIIVPVLYLVLRKLDKREHSWWIIPSLSIIMAAIVFGIGAKDRISNPQLNQMGVYTLNQNQLTGLHATTLLSNKSGEYTLSVPNDQFTAVTSSQNRPATDPQRGSVYTDKRKSAEIVFPDVGYWASKTIYGKAGKMTEGGFAADLTLKNNQLSGTIINNFNYDFEEIFIWSGNEKVKIGPLNKGEKINVDKTMKQIFLTSPVQSGFGYMPNGQNADLEEMRKDRLVYASSMYLLNGNGIDRGPLIAGFTKDSVIDVKMAEQEAKQHNTNLILAPFTAKHELSGSFTLKNEMLDSDVKVITGNIYEKGINGSVREMALDDGEYEYSVKLPKQLASRDYTLNELSIRTNSQSFIQYSLFNYETKQWESIDQKSYGLTSSDSIKPFISKEGELLIKLVKNAQGNPQVQLPAITIKGEVSP